MGLFFSERGDLSKVWYWIIVVVLVFAAIGAASQTTPFMQTSITPPAAQEKLTQDTLPAAEGLRTLDTRAREQRRKDTLEWSDSVSLIRPAGLESV